LLGHQIKPVWLQVLDHRRHSIQFDDCRHSIPLGVNTNKNRRVFRDKFLFHPESGQLGRRQNLLLAPDGLDRDTFAALGQHLRQHRPLTIGNYRLDAGIFKSHLVKCQA